MLIINIYNFKVTRGPSRNRGQEWENINTGNQGWEQEKSEEIGVGK